MSLNSEMLSKTWKVETLIKADMRIQGGQLMLNIKRRDKRRNNSATFNKRDYGIGWAVGSNQVPGSLGLHALYLRALWPFMRTYIRSGPWIKPTSIVMNHYRRTYYYYCQHIFIFISTSILFLLSTFISNLFIMNVK